MGGREDFVYMLDSVFVVPPIYDDSYYGYRIHEITEMQVARMGNYAHGNQPAQHMIYLYDWVDEPWKTQAWVRETMNRLYSAAPDGYCGDEDNGQTSAWYVFSALGFYPVCPGSDEYALGAPLFKNAIIHLENGNDIVICAENAKEDGVRGGIGKESSTNRCEPLNVFISEMKLDGELWNENFIRYSDLLDGAQLHFQMSDTPNYNRGALSK
jgi:predicted alpha-1,2-mannosidase